jgi:hypothetical protein
VHAAEEPLRLVGLVQPQGHLGLGEKRRWLRPGRRPRREIALADAQALSQLAQHLERGDAASGLDAGHVGRRTAGEGDIPLGQAGAQAGIAKPPPDCRSAVNVV